MSSIPEDLKGFGWRIEAMMPQLSDWMSQSDFDRASVNGFGAGMMCDGRSSSGIILDPRNQWLSLLQILVDRGLVDQKEEDGVFYYREYRAALSQGEEK